jgi:hypothetical protein
MHDAPAMFQGSVEGFRHAQTSATGANAGAAIQ